METKDILAIDSTERVLTQTRKHPIGLILTYVSTGIGMVAILGLLFVALKNSEDIGASDSLLIATFSIVAVVVGIVGYISAYIYKQNELVITNENIVQVLQFGLFNRQTSQLSLAKIQDVSVDQVGILASLLNYGTIEIETAGEKANFKFSFTPDPNMVAKIIIEAHEDFMRETSQHASTI